MKQVKLSNTVGHNSELHTFYGNQTIPLLSIYPRVNLVTYTHIHKKPYMKICNMFILLKTGDNLQETGLDDSQAEIKIAGRNINNLRYIDITLMV